jgi:RNA polymerase sigma-70 factor, ECF subfamily
MLEKSIKGLFRSQKTPALTAGDFARLYEEHVEAVFNYCLFRVGDRDLAEDLTAAVFERAWRARDRYQPDRAGFPTWLFAIARHAVIDMQRKKVRHPMMPLSARHQDENPLPETQAEQQERRHTLYHLLQALPAGEQELIALKFGVGMTNRQMAQLLGKSESAIGSAIHRIMQKLRQGWETAEEGNDHE